MDLVGSTEMFDATQDIDQNKSSQCHQVLIVCLQVKNFLDPALFGLQLSEKKTDSPKLKVKNCWTYKILYLEEFDRLELM